MEAPETRCRTEARDVVHGVRLQPDTRARRSALPLELTSVFWPATSSQRVADIERVVHLVARPAGICARESGDRDRGLRGAETLPSASLVSRSSFPRSGRHRPGPSSTAAPPVELPSFPSVKPLTLKPAERFATSFACGSWTWPVAIPAVLPRS